MRTIRHIMVATDDSEAADRAIDVAAAIIKAVGGELSILTVGEQLSRDEQRRLARSEGDIGDALESLSNRILKQANDRARRLGVSPTKVQVAWGDPAEAIIQAVQRGQIDAIAVGRRGRGKLARLLLGSVSQKVTSLAPCIVIVVP
jgi:nucleotide-binding universal stress UspA family protein